MGNESSSTGDISKKAATDSLPIDSAFNLPSPLPSWPSGEGFSEGRIDLGGLEVCEITTFNNVWTTYDGGPDNMGATFCEPASIPEGFFPLGFYAQPNNRKLSGWILAGKDSSGDNLKPPVDYVLVWSSESLNLKQNRDGYFWEPIPPEGFKSVGLVVSNSPEKPNLDKIRCVRADYTDQSEADVSIWGTEGFSVSSLRPSERGSQKTGVCVGSFTAQNQTTLSCLKNAKFDLSCLPNKSQIDSIFQVYSPLIYFHPKEKYLPSSVNWYFGNGALLYKKGEESNPVRIEPDGTNLPQGESNDGSYWLDLPVNKKEKERVKKGDFESTVVYLQIKPMLGATFTDIVVWMFYPFNGPARAKVKFLSNIPLGRIGEHIGDWEHLTLRISNFSGELRRVFLSQHSGGTWFEPSQLEFQGGTNKPMVYASRNGHAMYTEPGLVLQGKDGIGIRNDTAKGKTAFDMGTRFEVVASPEQTEPAWLNYLRKWGPNINYGYENEVRVVEKLLLIGSLKKAFRDFVKKLPKEVFGEDGPTGPKLKRNWTGDES